MKKLIKTGLAFCFVGIVLGVIGFLGHGFQHVVLNEHFVPVLVSQVKVKRTINVENAQQIKIDVDSEDVVVRRGNRFAVTVYGQKNRMPKVSTNKQVLTIRNKSADIGINFDFFGMNGNSELHRIVVTIPKGQALKTLNIQAGSGDFTVKQVVAKGGSVIQGNGNLVMRDDHFNGPFKINSGSGDVNGQRIVAKSANLTLDNGQLYLDKLQVTGHLVLSNSSGDMTLSNLYSGDTDLQMRNGELEANQWIFNGHLNCRNDSGNVDFKQTTFQNAKISLSSGDLNLSGGSIQKGLTAQVSPGDVAYKGASKKQGYTVKTGSGDANLFGETSDSGATLRRHLKAAIQNSFSSSSGDIEITE